LRQTRPRSRADARRSRGPGVFLINIDQISQARAHIVESARLTDSAGYMLAAWRRTMNDLRRLAGTLGQYRLTALALSLAGFVTAAMLVFRVNLVDLDLKFIDSSVEEIAAVWLIAGAAALVDRRWRRLIRLQEERARVVRMTMRAVYELVGNSLNDLQLLRLEAEGLVASETIAIFDASIHNTMMRLEALCDTPVIVAKDTAFGPGLDMERSTTAP
jgi:hypothetical protein